MSAILECLDCREAEINIRRAKGQDEEAIASQAHGSTWHPATQSCGDCGALFSRLVRFVPPDAVKVVEASALNLQAQVRKLEAENAKIRLETAKQIADAFADIKSYMASIAKGQAGIPLASQVPVAKDVPLSQLPK